MDMVRAGKYDDGDWVSYADYLDLENELTEALQLIEKLEADVQEYAESQPPI